MFVGTEKSTGVDAPLYGDAVLGATLDGRELVAVQRAAMRQVSFSLTLACPLRCAHCIVATVAAAEAPRVSVRPEEARAYARAMPALARAGVERISFTGGEPLLAREPLAILSEAAAAASLLCSVVTACHWARSERAAAQTVAAFPAVGRWHLSTDRYHLESLTLDHVRRAAWAVAEAGREVVVRLAAPKPFAAQDREIAEALAEMLPPGARMAIQPVSAVGRAEGLGLPPPAARRGDRAWTPCMSTGLVVRHDGTTRPCCSSLVDVDVDHAFVQVDAHQGLAEAYHAWRADPLLKLVQAVGFLPLADWIRADCDGSFGNDLPEHPCDQCLACWRVPGAAEAVRRRFNRPGVAEKVDHLHQQVFGQVLDAAAAEYAL